MKKILIVIIIIILLSLALNANNILEIPNLKPIQKPNFENANYNLTFCPQENCTNQLNMILQNAQKEIICALFDLDIKEMKNTLKYKSNEINVSILIDAHNNEDLNYSFIKVKDFYGLMHNKFCVIDNKITFTGSFNPTTRGATKNNNNVLITNASVIANNYHNYYNFLLKTKNENRKNLNYTFPHKNYFYTEDANVKNFFCPWDSCSKNVIKELELAQESIYFMTFAFTDKNIANTILIKHYNGVDVKGVFEKKQNSKYSTYNLLLNNSIKVITDHNKYNMHHKVFIIDNKTVILGSYNPTNNGNKKNDENILVITNKDLANEFIQEFDRAYGE